MSIELTEAEFEWFKDFMITLEDAFDWPYTDLQMIRQILEKVK